MDEDFRRELEERLRNVVDSIGDAEIRTLVKNVLEEGFTHSEVEPTIPFERAPASRSTHHAYPGGLLEHTVSVAEMAVALAEVFGGVYGVEVNVDIVRAAAVLHDYGKVTSYEEKEDGGYKLSDLGRRIDHLSVITAELYARGAPLELVHAVAAHHGRGSPVPPNTPEAMIVHQADRTDAEMATEVFRAARNVVAARLKELGVEPEGGLVDAIIRELSPAAVFEKRIREGREAVREMVAEALKEVRDHASNEG